jgi:pimeloyl-ACP methyl ester carboxylesterase
MHDIKRIGARDTRYVLVHGIGAASRYFAALARVLADVGTVHSLELPGYGRTPKTQDLLTVDGLASLTAAYLATLGPGPTVLVGHSMGAQTVTEVARSHPELVSGLVLIGPVCEPAARTALHAAARLALDTLREPLSTNIAVFSDYLAFGLRRYLGTLPAMLDYRLEDNLPKLTVPVLVLRGARDPIASASWCRELASAAEDGTFVEIPDSAHVAQHTAPTATATAISTWTRRRR